MSFNATPEQWDLIARTLPEQVPMRLQRAMWKALAVVGAVSTGKYMVQTGTGASSALPGVSVAVNPTRLTWRSGRLARSLMLQGAGLTPTEGIGEVKPEAEGIRGTIGTRVPYARPHELGMTQAVTPRQKGFFFWRYKETGEEMWLAMALSKSLHTPARPFLGPALADGETLEGINNVFSAEINELYDDAVSIALP